VQYLIRQTYRVKKGDTILLHAAAGGIGSILVAMGQAFGRDGDRHGRQRREGETRQGQRLRTT
jgi:NADPH:quinone reductase-like Zn-dependent oxidoreductase